MTGVIGSMVDSQGMPPEDVEIPATAKPAKTEIALPTSPLQALGAEHAHSLVRAARHQADKIIFQARTKATEILAEAEQRAAETENTARHRANQMIRAAEDRVENIRAKTSPLAHKDEQQALFSQCNSSIAEHVLLVATSVDEVAVAARFLHKVARAHEGDPPQDDCRHPAIIAREKKILRTLVAAEIATSNHPNAQVFTQIRALEALARSVNSNHAQALLKAAEELRTSDSLDRSGDATRTIKTT